MVAPWFAQLTCPTNGDKWFQSFFMFTPENGEDEPIFTHIFQMGWGKTPTSESVHNGSDFHLVRPHDIMEVTENSGQRYV